VRAASCLVSHTSVEVVKANTKRPHRSVNGRATRHGVENQISSMSSSSSSSSVTS